MIDERKQVSFVVNLSDWDSFTKKIMSEKAAMQKTDGKIIRHNATIVINKLLAAFLAGDLKLDLDMPYMNSGKPSSTHGVKLDEDFLLRLKIHLLKNKCNGGLNGLIVKCMKSYLKESL